MVNLNGLLLALWNAWWLLLTAGGMAGLVAYHTVRQTPPTYVAMTTLLVGDVLRSPKPGDSEFSVTQSIATGYAQLMQRQPILESTIRKLGLPFGWEELRRRIVVIHPIGSLTIEIRVMDTAPERARDIAAALADQLVASSPTVARRQELEQRRQFIREEMNDLQLKIQQARDEVDRKRAALPQETNARAVLDRQDEIRTAEQKIDGWRTSYNALLASLDGHGDPNSLTIIEPAAIPTQPSSPRSVWYVVLAILGGLLVAGSGVIMIELLNDRIRSQDDLQRALREGAEGLVAYIPQLRSGRGPLVVVSEPESAVADAYRLLAAQLRFGVLGTGPHLVMVTSATNGEGKSTTAANLGAALALGGTNVLLVDLDLRKPSLHAMFNLPNRGGAAAMLRDHDSTIERYALATMLPNLRLLPAGTVIGNPSELLSRSSEALLLAAWATAEIVIIDSPPLLAVPDATVLTGSVPDTICVARFERTSGRDLRAAVEILDGLPTRLRGIVLNAVPWKKGKLTGYRYFEPRKMVGAWQPFARRSRAEALAGSSASTVTAARSVGSARPTPGATRDL